MENRSNHMNTLKVLRQIDQRLWLVIDPTQRFSNRVVNYVKYRPHYPSTLLEFCQTTLGLTPAHIIADIGAGTGISSELFIANGNTVYGIEPNEAMRTAAIEKYTDQPLFHAIDGRAEATTLQDSSVDVVIVGQAFHWFDQQAFEAEARRILKPGGWLVIMWNTRTADSEFNSKYEELCVHFGVDYKDVHHEAHRDGKLLDHMEKTILENCQQLDLEGLTGRFLSSSYSPTSDHPEYKMLLRDIYMLFQEYQTNGKITIKYDTEVFYTQF